MEEWQPAGRLQIIFIKTNIFDYNMSKIEVYCTKICPYCRNAESFLNRKGVEYTKIFVDNDPDLWKQMEERSKRRTVPQIFIGDFHVGGFDDMMEMEADGKLETLLQQAMG